MFTNQAPRPGHRQPATGDREATKKLYNAPQGEHDAHELQLSSASREQSKRLDVLVLAPPPPTYESARHAAAPDQYRQRRPIIWPQTTLAQIAAVVYDAGYNVDVIDAVGFGLDWVAIEQYVWEHRPRYIIVNVAATTLTNDMRATLLGKVVGAVTIAIGAYVTPASRETLEAYPTLDIIVRGEPELTVLDVICTIDQTLEGQRHHDTTSSSGNTLNGHWRNLPFPDAAQLSRRFSGVHPNVLARALREIHGVAFRNEHSNVQINPDRPFIENLDCLPLPLHNKLPWHNYALPFIGGPYTTVLTSRGCPASCRYCIKHVTYQSSVRHRSPGHVLEELYLLKTLGIRHIHFEADLFTVKKDFIYDFCNTLIKDGLKLPWSCNSRIDFVDDAELALMKQAGCCMIAWGLESGSEAVLKRARRTTPLARAHQTLAASRKIGIQNWGHFIIGLPGETIETIQETIQLSKRLPLNIAWFHIATPHPGTPFYYEAVENGWIRTEPSEGSNICAPTALNYPHLSAQQLEYWTRRAAREWSWRIGPMMTFLKNGGTTAAFLQLLRNGFDQQKWMGGSLQT